MCIAVMYVLQLCMSVLQSCLCWNNVCIVVMSLCCSIVYCSDVCIVVIFFMLQWCICVAVILTGVLQWWCVLQHCLQVYCNDDVCCNNVYRCIAHLQWWCVLQLDTRYLPSMALPLLGDSWTMVGTSRSLSKQKKIIPFLSSLADQSWQQMKKLCWLECFIRKCLDINTLLSAEQV